MQRKSRVKTLSRGVRGRYWYVLRYLHVPINGRIEFWIYYGTIGEPKIVKAFSCTTSDLNEIPPILQSVIDDAAAVCQTIERIGV